MQYTLNTLISRIEYTADGSQFTNGETSFSCGFPFSDPDQYGYRQEVKERLMKNDGFCKNFSDLAERWPDGRRNKRQKMAHPNRGEGWGGAGAVKQ